MSIVEVNNLFFSYPGREAILNDISFSVSTGEALVVAGLSGSGKTTLCRILCGIIPHAVKGDVSGEVTVADLDPREAGLPQTALKAGMVFQDSDSQIICTTVEDEIAFALENLCLPPEEIRLRVEELLAEFGLIELRCENPAKLSGGMKKLLAIASVLAPAPPVLILDEPMSGLDSEGRELVRSVIEEQRDNGKAVIMVEHDLSLAAFADKWLLIHEGAVAACDTPERLMEREGMLKELRLMP